MSQLTSLIMGWCWDTLNSFFPPPHICSLIASILIPSPNMEDALYGKAQRMVASLLGTPTPPFPRVFTLLRPTLKTYLTWFGTGMAHKVSEFSFGNSPMTGFFLMP